jgi:Uma2 family endonuclease
MGVAITKAADGFPRRAFNADEIRRMTEAGILDEGGNVEPIDGDLVVMPARYARHELIKGALGMALVRWAPDGVIAAVATTLQLAEDVLVEPDIAVFPRSVFIAGPQSFFRPRPEDVGVLIEIAASSLPYDRGVKARLYARHGIREFWVIDADERITWVHTGPTGDGWSSIEERGPKDELTAPALPGFSIRLGEIS